MVKSSLPFKPHSANKGSPPFPSVPTFVAPHHTSPTQTEGVALPPIKEVGTAPHDITPTGNPLSKEPWQQPALSLWGLSMGRQRVLLFQIYGGGRSGVTWPWPPFFYSLWPE